MESDKSIGHLPILTGSENYPEWEKRVKAFLRIKGLLEHVENAPPDQAGAALEQNKKAGAYIQLALDPSLSEIIAGAVTGTQALMALKSVFTAQSMARVIYLQREFAELSLQDGESVLQYIARGRRVRTQLAVAGSTETEHRLCTQILRGLPDSYDSTVEVISGSHVLGSTMTINGILPMLLSREETISKRPQQHAFFGRAVNRGGKKPQGRTGSNDRSSHKDKKCFYCGKTGHFKAECYKRLREQGSGEQGRSRKDPVLAAAFMAAAGYTDDTMWSMDTAASAHLSTSIEGMRDLRPSSTTILTSSGPVAAQAEGTLELRTQLSNGSEAVLTLRDVLYVPNAPTNLLSVPKAVTGQVLPSFSADGRSMQLSYNGSIVAEAELESSTRLYIMRARRSSAYSHRAMAMAAITKDTPQLLHRRLGHAGYDDLARLTSMVKGINISPSEIKAAGQDGAVCEACVMGKQHKLPFTKDAGPQSSQLLDVIHTDVCGPMSTPTPEGYKYFITFLDDYSKASSVRLLKRKDEVSQAVKDTLQQWAQLTGKSVRAVRSDRGREYIAGSLNSYFKEHGITHQLTAGYTPQQNGAAERFNRTLVERARSMLIDAGLPTRMWGEAVMAANYLRNRLPVRDKDSTPWQLLVGEQPDLSHLRAFGARAYVLTPQQFRTKLDPSSKPGVMVGYLPGNTGYRVLLDSTGKVVTSREVLFDESIMPRQAPSMAPQRSGMTVDLMHDVDGSSPLHTEAPATGAGAAGPSNTTAATEQTPATEEAADPSEPAPQRLRTSARSNRGAPPQRYHDSYVHMAVELKEPATLEEAYSSPQSEQWQEAVAEELEALEANQTWEQCALPHGKQAIPTKWVFKVKRDSTGNIERFKARLVVKGYRQQEGIDYTEVFAPVSHYSTLRALLAKVAAEDLELHQLDFKTAFLNGVLEEEVYIQPPPGSYGGQFKPGQALRLHKALYGLKQAPRTWHQRLHQELTEIGLQASEADPGLYTSSEGDIYVLVYVDDLLIAAPDINSISSLMERLQRTFKARDLGEAGTFLGITIMRDRVKKTIRLHQSRLIKHLLEQYQLEAANPRSTPFNTGLQLTASEGTPLTPDQASIYGNLVGTLLYISNCSRPDIAYAAGVLARFLAQPTTTHWTAAKGVARYIAGTANAGLVYGGDSRLIMEGYCDADYAGDPDTRRSTTGYVFLMGGAAISWSSKRQPIVTASTMEAEYVAAAAAVKEALWLRKLRADLRLSTEPPTINGDNQSTLKLLRNPIATQRSKHIDVAYKFARERVARGELAFKYVNSSDMLADCLTKALAKQSHMKCCEGMGLQQFAAAAA